MSHRLASLPALVIELIFAIIHPSECLKFRRLCHATNAILTSRHFARLSLQRHLPSTPPPRVSKDPTLLDRIWFHWPDHFQDLYATLWLRECTEIRWRNCNLSGVIPPSIGHLHNLTYLSLASNHLHGTLPDSLTSLTNLTHLFLSGNALTGRLPGNLFTALPHLSHASLRANCLSGALPESTRPALRELYLDCNAFDGAPAPDLVRALKGLRGEYLRGNAFARGEVCAARWRGVGRAAEVGVAPCV
ncbi:hypothetical protein BC830DRAFT_1169024 [Chytriomyces sp. MP71]|nr:hypothetical protein BC830DRAFT_1169024 [Chytriomyces sp. MP71]